MRINKNVQHNTVAFYAMVMIIEIFLVGGLTSTTTAFEFPNPLKAFQKQKEGTTLKSPLSSSISLPKPVVTQTKKQLLQAVSFTNNGKDASLETQKDVLNLVRTLEVEAPVISTILSDPDQAKRLDGIWYLQYTSPSDIGGIPETDTWKAENLSQEEIFGNRKYQNNGSVGAVGIKVNTANKVTQQIFDVETSRVTNTVEQDYGSVRVEGSFRPSESVPTRAIVAFDTAEITFTNGFVLNLGFVFSTLGLIKGTKDNGWLETTYLDNELRIGRGDKGTMFVLTRSLDAVQP